MSNTSRIKRAKEDEKSLRFQFNEIIIAPETYQSKVPFFLLFFFYKYCSSNRKNDSLYSTMISFCYTNGNSSE